MVNRCALILKYREPMIRWINEADPYNDHTDISAERLRNERTVYLLPEIPVDMEKAIEEWIDANLDNLFESEFGGWYTDPDLWPRGRSPKLFREWFEIEYHSVIVDTVGGELYDDEA
jgi:hypothetical protein